MLVVNFELLEMEMKGELDIETGELELISTLVKLMADEEILVLKLVTEEKLEEELVGILCVVIVELTSGTADKKRDQWKFGHLDIAILPVTLTVLEAFPISDSRSS